MGGPAIDVGEVLFGGLGSAGVRRLLLDSKPRAALRHALKSLLEEGAELGACRLTRAKFAPGRLQGNYTITVRGAGQERAISRAIHVAWLAPMPGEDPAIVLSDTAPTPAGAPFLNLAAAVPEWGMRIQVSPYDAAFPQLRHLLDPGHVAGAIRAVQATPFGAPAPATSWAATTIRYRPGARHVLRYDPLGPSGAPLEGGGALFAKLAKGQDSLQLFQIGLRVADWTAGSGLRTLAPIAHLDRDAAVLYPQAPGTTLSHLLTRSSPELPDRLAQLGSALARLHGAPEGIAQDLPQRTFEDVLRTPARANKHLRPLLGHSAESIDILLTRAEQLHDQLTPEAPRLCHGDLKADHVLAQRDGGLMLIDLDSAALAEPALDVGKFLADLQWWHPASRPGLIDAQRRFLEAYATGAGQRSLAAVRLYEAVVLLGIALHRVPLSDPDWAARIGVWIDRAQAILEGVEAS